MSSRYLRIPVEKVISGPGLAVPMDVIATARRMLSRDLCPNCFGRFFSRLGYRMGNDVRGSSLITVLAMIGETGGLEDAEILRLRRLTDRLHDLPDTPSGADLAPEGDVQESTQTVVQAPEPLDPADCTLCEGICQELDDLAELCVDDGVDIEWERFALGCRLDEDMLRREEELALEFGIEGAESLKNEVNREVALRMGRITGKEGDRRDPHVTFLLDVPFRSVSHETTPVLYYGRYRKMSRFIPQTRWPCRECRGKGCDRCGRTGKMYATSVEEEIGRPFLEALGGDNTRFHGMGREDVDALMLGTGRPFVVEILHPQRRTIDDDAVFSTIDTSRVEVLEFQRCTKAMVQKVKNADPRKSYEVTFRCDPKPTPEEIGRVMELLPLTIPQRTPTRVKHRRGDRFRDRTVHELHVDPRDVVEPLTGDPRGDRGPMPGVDAAPELEGPGPGGILNLTTLSSDIKLSWESTQNYLNHLKQAYLVFTLPKYSKSAKETNRSLENESNCVSSVVFVSGKKESKVCEPPNA